MTAGTHMRFISSKYIIAFQTFRNRWFGERKRPAGANRIYNGGMADVRPTDTMARAAQESGLPPRVILVLARLDPRALGIALGTVCGLSLWLATIILFIRGGANAGQNLALLSQYFLGFRVTPAGSAAAFAYGFLIAYLVGYVFARLRNFMLHTYLLYVRRRAEREALTDLLDRVM
jgi:hypothetical protein